MGMAYRKDMGFGTDLLVIPKTYRVWEDLGYQAYGLRRYRKDNEWHSRAPDFRVKDKVINIFCAGRYKERIGIKEHRWHRISARSYIQFFQTLFLLDFFYRLLPGPSVDRECSFIRFHAARLFSHSLFVHPPVR